VTPTAADPTEVQNGIENRFDRSKEEGSFLKKRVQKTKRRKDRDGREDKKTEKTKVADETKIRHDF
jgi:hypothetical protein